MFKLRLFDPIGLAAKDKELRELRQKIEAIEDRELELREENRYYRQPKPARRKAVAR